MEKPTENEKDACTEIKFESNGFCSFCLRPADEINVLIQSEGFPICNDCIKACYHFLEEQYPQKLNLPGNGWITK